MRKREPTLTAQELAIMKVVWRLGQPTVRDVYHALLETRHIAYTTVMTMMNILETKGYLKKEKTARAARLLARRRSRMSPAAARAAAHPHRRRRALGPGDGVDRDRGAARRGVGRAGGLARGADSLDRARRDSVAVRVARGRPRAPP